MGCNHNCSSCNEKCDERDLHINPNELSNIKNIIGVVSGKGGVGKSMVTSLIATDLSKRGYKVGILDADITGPSIPKMFGIKGKATGNEKGILPRESIGGIKIMSANLLLEDDTDPVIWRGPVIAGTVQQFYTDVIYGELDYLLIDMPPGTGDVPLTVFQSIKMNGIVVVTSPQDLVSMIVEKAVKMASKMNIKIFGLVENMSYFHCPDNDKDYKLFGESHIEDAAKRHNLLVLDRLPIDPYIRELADNGEIEKENKSYLKNTVLEIIK